VSVCRFGACGIFSALRTRRIVEALTPVTDLEQLALDPLVPPAVVLGGEPPDQRGDLCANWRPARAARIGPTGGDQAVCSQLPWQVPDQRSHDGSVGPVEAGPGIGAARHGDLVPEQQQLRVRGR
jgi:hypothetical protein